MYTKAVFGEKIPMARGLNRAAKDVILSRSMNLFIFEIPPSKL